MGSKGSVYRYPTQEICTGFELPFGLDFWDSKLVVAETSLVAAEPLELNYRPIAGAGTRIMADAPEGTAPVFSGTGPGSDLNYPRGANVIQGHEGDVSDAPAAKEPQGQHASAASAAGVCNALLASTEEPVIGAARQDKKSSELLPVQPPLKRTAPNKISLRFEDIDTLKALRMEEAAAILGCVSQASLLISLLKLWIRALHLKKKIESSLLCAMSKSLSTGFGQGMKTTITAFNNFTKIILPLKSENTLRARIKEVAAENGKDAKWCRWPSRKICSNEYKSKQALARQRLKDKDAKEEEAPDTFYKI